MKNWTKVLEGLLLLSLAFMMILSGPAALVEA